MDYGDLIMALVTLATGGLVYLATRKRDTATHRIGEKQVEIDAQELHSVSLEKAANAFGELAEAYKTQRDENEAMRLDCERRLSEERADRVKSERALIEENMRLRNQLKNGGNRGGSRG